MRNSLRYIVLFLFLTSLTSCITFKRNASKGSNSNYETFYINDSTMQYFIKPIEFINQNQVFIDFTFRKTKLTFSDVTMNFTFISQNKRNIEKLDLICSKIRYSIAIKKMMYKETKNNKFIYRYNTIISFNELNDFLLSAEPIIEIDNEIMKSTKKTIKMLSRIKSDLFEFELINE